MTRARLVLILVIAGLALTGALAAQQARDTRPDVALQAALKVETIDGDLKAAIELYRELADGADRAVAAQALVRMGQCYEKLGSSQTAEARKAYERVVAQFADQKDAVAEARAKLAAGVSSTGSPSDARLLMVSDDARVYGKSVSRDGRDVAFVMPYRYGRGPVVVIQDLVTGGERRVAAPYSSVQDNTGRWSPVTVRPQQALQGSSADR